MDSDFLEEYERREIEAFNKNNNVAERLEKLKSPIFNIVEPCGSIWGQVAFSGTVIFPLHPLPQQVFEKGHNISIKEFPDLIQFVKDTKKIQFVLTDLPTNYKEFEYLEPLLTELEPPLYTQTGGKDKRLQDLTIESTDEINFLIPFSPKWTFLSHSISGNYIITDYIRDYTMLRYQGFNDIADVFIDNFLADPEFAQLYIQTAYDLLVHPIIDPFKANPSFSIETLQRANQLGIQSKISQQKSLLPEVGSFLMKKCTHYPSSLHACKNIIGEYEDYDLYSVYSALNDAVNDRKDSEIISKNCELQDILDNVWNDTRIKSYSTGYYYGINIACGMIGYCLGGGAPGFFTALGLKTLDSSKSRYIDKISESISKRAAPPYLASVYDFKNKYPSVT